MNVMIVHVNTEEPVKTPWGATIVTADMDGQANTVQKVSKTFSFCFVKKGLTG